MSLDSAVDDLAIHAPHLEQSRDLPVVNLQNHSVRLRALANRDVDALYQIVSTESYISYWRYRGRTVSLEQFRKDLWTDVLTQFVVESIEPRQVLGLVSAYQANHRNQTVYLSIVSTPAARGKGAPLNRSGALSRLLVC